ncbi:MAG: hypothetical protein GY814_06500 [Gammaproteobacteria bacterium]|nr:hypothetical protein [Gammaproteobacteria bacterium]
MSYFKVFIYALLTAPLILFNVSHASVYTTGDLQYDSGKGVITNLQTQQTYLGWDVLSSYTYQETLDATAIGGSHSGYHIANFDEAKTFFEAAMPYSVICDVTPGVDTYCDTYAGIYFNGAFGDNYGTDSDDAWFLASGGSVGHIIMEIMGGGTHLSDRPSTIRNLAYTDKFSASGEYQSSPVSWLLVANTTLSTVPVPAAIWLFGTALIGLVGYGKRKSKVPV